MPQYTAPLRDMNFVLHELLQVQKQYRTIPAFAETDRETMDSILALAAKFNENELSPINRSGDEEGCHYDNGAVRTPTGFKEAYAKYVELGLGSLAEPVSRGGLGLPPSLAMACNEMIGGANRAWGMYPCLNHGAIKSIAAHGSPEQVSTYLPKLVTGEWTATMCLTESHAGSDLGLVRTRAEARADGSYAISGTKIFISGGEHDFTDNIVHIVLARLPDAPKGTKGISLFIVPKFLVNADGSLGARNTVSCGSLEHKMGLKGSATCVMNFDGAKGFLIGQPNKGLNYMFIFMNSARLGVALQGVAGMEAAYQGSLAYARDRLAMRALSGPKMPEQAADAIIVHPAVRNMLLTQKAFTEGGRALVYWLASHEDRIIGSTDEESRRESDALLGLMTPIAKAVLTELGLEAAKHGIQIYGGHGFIREWGMEQMVRDARVATLYEGTTEIQALDLLGRKVLANQGQQLKLVTDAIHTFCREQSDNPAMQEFVTPLAALCQEWEAVTRRIGLSALGNPDEVGAAAVDYLYFSGYVMLAYVWAMMAGVAQKALVIGTPEEKFYQAKLHTARFYFRKILPRTKTHLDGIDAGMAALMAVELF
ncbi:MAG: acyl-CoA dehydrogenase C-terminal domain-containing protein [Fluviicoccus sp.]|uniref:acyl-CoA dehydrogenase C-terminal domain-containing protein n=1 Tax=Fluviicoccus sp. TaxID=2003552 RepID=UPI002721EAB9|nr:acyl-CoA dehydrogenase C-terminal domain-containing protein [Fluviicoccus sp.]MDO8331918.1 acyl-CoA dehydrogenase C-terminal domain-containing protein [Fluviicoccus sp.]